ncbi:MAG: alpha-galactosidase [Clostridia bacterium]|nr:alpha-galactosidase [Clostridia bacterium]
MNKEKRKLLIEAAITTVLSGLVIYAAYSLWYIFYGKDSGADVHLYTVLSGLGIGWALTLLTGAVFKNSKLIPKIIAFLVGTGLFQGIIWGYNEKFNPVAKDNEIVIIKTFTVTFALLALSFLTAFIIRAVRKNRAVNIVLAVFFFALFAGGNLVINEENIRALDYKKNIEFAAASAEDMKLTADEKETAEKWLQENFFTENSTLPFTFKVDGEVFDPEDWERTVEKTDNTKYQNGETKNLIFKNEEKALEVRAEITAFKENATCQWTVYIKNTGSENSGVISDFYAMDYSLPTGKADIYYSVGSDTHSSDFSLIKKTLNNKERRFSGADGKPTEKNLPYFNVCGEKLSAVAAVGWTGQWEASFKAENENARIKVKQEKLEAYLLPGEEIRSPLVSLGFYKGDNALKGFNNFRSRILDSVYPENVTKNHYTVMEIAGPMSKRTSDEIIEILDGLGDDIFSETDAFWMDAGWYSYNEGWHDGVGNWTVDTSRYDNGISELSDYAKEKELGLVLWYEPERLYPGTQFHTKGLENEQWLIDAGEDNIMWNLADEDAFNYYCGYLLNSMKENGITVYRQDFNFAPLKYWEKADREYYGGRTGITENHYISNLYRFLDYLTENIDGLIIDNCASGGKRLDLEMAYRSIPFWRSDYNCDFHTDLFEATQSHTYGISFWLPVTGSAQYMLNEYSARSDIMPLMLMDFFAHQNPEFGLYHEQRELMAGNYFPIEFGNTDKTKMHALSFNTRDGREGTALIYKRADVKREEYTVKLNGLIPGESYNIYDYDAPDTVFTFTGEELMTKGITIPLPEGEKAIILMYEVI